MQTNFDFLETHEPIFLQLAQAAERAFNPDPNTTLVKLRQLGEAFAKEIASRVGLSFDANTKQVDLLREIEDVVGLDRTVRDLFHTLRKLGNSAAHEYVSSHHEALQALQIAWKLSIWFHRTSGDASVKGFSPPPFQKPEDPAEKLRLLELEVQRLKSEQNLAQVQLEQNQQLLAAEQQRTRELEDYAARQAEERQVWETLAAEQEEISQQLSARFELQLAENLAVAVTAPAAPSRLAFLQSLSQPSIDLSEAETRIIIDQQLREAGWEVDSENLRYSKGARPLKGTFRAIAEWPTEHKERADYVLFYGTTALAVVEAKKKTVDVSGSIDQAKRYSRGFLTKDACTLPSGGVALPPLQQKPHHSGQRKQKKSHASRKQTMAGSAAHAAICRIQVSPSKADWRIHRRFLLLRIASCY